MYPYLRESNAKRPARFIERELKRITKYHDKKYYRTKNNKKKKEAKIENENIFRGEVFIAIHDLAVKRLLEGGYLAFEPARYSEEIDEVATAAAESMVLAKELGLDRKYDYRHITYQFILKVLAREITCARKEYTFNEQIDIYRNPEAEEQLNRICGRIEDKEPTPPKTYTNYEITRHIMDEYVYIDENTNLYKNLELSLMLSLARGKLVTYHLDRPWMIAELKFLIRQYVRLDKKWRDSAEN